MADSILPDPVLKVKRIIFLILGPLLFASVWLIPLPDFEWQGETIHATAGMRTAIGLALWMGVWWVSEAVTMAAASLLPLIVLPLAGVMTAQQTAPIFFSDIIALFFGGLCLALAMERTGLHRHISAVALRIFGGKPRNIVLGLMAAAAVTSMWVSNTATTLSFLPVAMTLGSAASDQPGGRRFGIACVLAVAFGASIGGVGTLIGTSPNAFLLGEYQRRFADEIRAGEMVDMTFGRWMMMGVPIAATLVPICWLILTRLYPRVEKTLDEAASKRLNEIITDRGPLLRDQFVVMVTFLITASLWITRSEITISGWSVPLTGWGNFFLIDDRIAPSDGTVAIFAAILVMAIPSKSNRGEALLPWDFASNRLPWNALLLLGGGLCLAEAFERTGLDSYVLAGFATVGDMHPLLLVLATVVVMTVISEIASNTAAAALAIPLLASIAVAMGVPPPLLMIAGALGASSGYALPVATPPNTIAFASGAISVKDLALAGGMLDVAAIIVMTSVVYWVVPVIFQMSW